MTVRQTLHFGVVPGHSSGDARNPSSLPTCIGTSYLAKPQQWAIDAKKKDAILRVFFALWCADMFSVLPATNPY